MTRRPVIAPTLCAAAALLLTACTAPPAVVPATADPPPGSTAPSPEPPEDMVLVPAGDGLAAFYIDRTEVTVGAYEACVAAGACEPATHRSSTCEHVWRRQDVLDYGGVPDEAMARAPVGCVASGWPEQFCAWAGKRVPSGAEWKRAALGDDGRLFPWGDEPPDCERAAICNGPLDPTYSPWPVGSKPGDISPFGALDMAGNVHEWTTDGWSGAGDWSSRPTDGFQMRIGISKNQTMYGTFGFRCVRDVAAE